MADKQNRNYHIKHATTRKYKATSKVKGLSTKGKSWSETVLKRIAPRYVYRHDYMNPLLDPIKKIDPIIMANIAGLFEGDGHASLRLVPNDKSGSITGLAVVSIGLSDPEWPMIIGILFGVKVTKISFKKGTCKNGGTRKPLYYVNFTQTLASIFLEQIIPFLRSDKLQDALTIVRHFNSKFTYETNTDMKYAVPWLSGFSEAEGSFRMKLVHSWKKFKKGRRKRAQYKVEYTLTNTEQDILYYARNVMERAGLDMSHVYIKKDNRTNGITARERNAGHYKEAYLLAIRVAKNLVPLYHLLVPYMGMKRKIAAVDRTLDWFQLNDRLDQLGYKRKNGRGYEFKR